MRGAKCLLGPYYPTVSFDVIKNGGPTWSAVHRANSSSQSQDSQLRYDLENGWQQTTLGLPKFPSRHSSQTDRWGGWQKCFAWLFTSRQWLRVTRVSDSIDSAGGLALQLADENKEKYHLDARLTYSHRLIALGGRRILRVKMSILNTMGLIC